MTLAANRSSRAVSGRPRERILAAAGRLFLDDPEARFAGLWTALEQRLAEEAGGSLVVIVAIELRRTPRHQAWKAIAEHRMAVRQLLEDVVKPLNVADPPILAAQLQLLIEGTEAAALAGEPVGALDLRVLADALRR